MQRWHRLCLWAVLVAISLAAGGCGSSSMSGLRGKVVDENGQPLAGVTVFIPEAGLAVKTGTNGVYQIAPLAPREYKVLATRFGYSSAELTSQFYSTLAATESSIIVQVTARKIANVPDIVLRQNTGVDTAVFTSITPAPTSSLPAGTTQTLNLQVDYRLVSADTASLRIFIYFYPIGNQNQAYLYKSGILAISKGEDTVTWTPQIKIPHGLAMCYTTVIVNEKSTVTAYNETGLIPISGAQAPKAPTVTAENTANGIKLTWSGSNYINFESLTIKREANLSTTTLAKFSDLAALPATYVDTTAEEATKYYYWVCYKPLGMSEVCNASTSIVRAVKGLTFWPISTGISDILVDAGRNLVYASSANTNQVLVLSADTGATVRQISISWSPGNMAISADKNKLFVVTSATSSITVIDLATYQTTQLPLVGTPISIAVPPNGTELYITLRKNSSTVLQAISVANGAVLREVTTSNLVSSYTGKKHLALSADGARLIVASYSDILWLKAVDFTTDHTWSSTSAPYGILANPNPDRPEIYVGRDVLQLQSPWLRTDVLPVDISGVNSAGDELYAFSNGSDFVGLQRYTSNGLAYNLLDTVTIPGSIGTIAANKIGDKLYFVLKSKGTYTNPVGIGVLDYSQRP